jgi:lipopolysaccharide export system protein LptA
MTTMTRYAILILSYVFFGTIAFAQSMQLGFGSLSQDVNAPVEITADALSVDQETGSAKFEGNVLIAQGDMRLSADQVTVTYAKERAKIARLNAAGNVTLVSGNDAAEAQKADYDIDGGVVVMRGDVLVSQAGMALQAQEALFNLSKQTAELKGRVKTILKPQNNK